MKKKLKSLEDWNTEATIAYTNKVSSKKYEMLNGIECPKCGCELMDTNPNIVLSTIPPKKHIHCSNCDYKEYRISY